MCERSAPTPGVLTTSYRASSSTSGESFRSSDRGCPIPPEAPATTVWKIVSISRHRDELQLRLGFNAIPALTILTVGACDAGEGFRVQVENVGGRIWLLVIVERT